jgi:hypothetical protein
MLLLQDQPVALVPAGPLHHCLEGSPPLMPHCLGLQTFGVTWAAVWMWSVLRISASGAPDNSHGYDHQPCIAVCNRLRVSVVLSSRRSVGARAGGGGNACCRSSPYSWSLACHIRPLFFVHCKLNHTSQSCGCLIMSLAKLRTRGSVGSVCLLRQ